MSSAGRRASTGGEGGTPTGSGRGRGTGKPRGVNEKSYILGTKEPRQPGRNTPTQGRGSTGTGQQPLSKGKTFTKPPQSTSPDSASPSTENSGTASKSKSKAVSAVVDMPPGIPQSETSLSSPSSVNTNDDLHQLVNEMDDSHKSTLPQASFNYINSIIGSGVIGMPYALQQSGVGVGLILLILVAVVTDYSLVIMVKAGELSGSYSYQGMMETAFGKWGFYVLSLIQFVYPVIAMISYNIIVGDTLTKVLTYFTSTKSEEFQREAVVLFATFFVTLPLSLYRNVARMAKISFLSLVSIGFILLSILIKLGQYRALVPVTTDAWQFSSGGILQAIGVFSFAFMCHHNTFMIYKSMENTSQSKWAKVTHVSIGTSLVVSIVFALGGYATFNGNVQGDLLENYCWDDDLINISRVLFCVTILLTFPLECFVARDVIETICFSGKQPPSTTRHFSVTFLIVLAAFVASMATDCLGVVLELNGILAAMPLAYILPALCFIRLEPSRFFSREKIPAIATALFGTLVSVTGLIMLVVRGGSENTCSHGKPMPYCTLSPNIEPALNSTSIGTKSFPAVSSLVSELLPRPQS